MNSTYAQKSSTVQKAADSKAASVPDSSAQGESLQRKADMANNATQRAEAPRPNNTGMPDNLKAGIESLSGFSMDNVRVHYNSSKPATVQALAYTQGTDIHVAPGQEKCLPHEAWHVAQQMAGRVSPTTNINGMPVNDNAALEHEADVMGEKAVSQRKEKGSLLQNMFNGCMCVQMFEISGDVHFESHHLVTLNDYNDDIDRLDIKTRAPFNNLHTIDLKTVGKYNELKGKARNEKDKNFLATLRTSVKNVNADGRGKFNDQKLDEAFESIRHNTNAFKKAKKRNQYNSITCKEFLKSDGSSYEGNYKLDEVKSISCDKNDASIAKAESLPALYKKIKKDGTEYHEFFHLGELR